MTGGDLPLSDGPVIHDLVVMISGKPRHDRCLTTTVSSFPFSSPPRPHDAWPLPGRSRVITSPHCPARSCGVDDSRMNGPPSNGPFARFDRMSPILSGQPDWLVHVSSTIRNRILPPGLDPMGTTNLDPPDVEPDAYVNMSTESRRTLITTSSPEISAHNRQRFSDVSISSLTSKFSSQGHGMLSNRL
jgi:hypothetical protein